MIDETPDDPRLDDLADRVLGGSPGDRAELDDPEYLAYALAAAAADLAEGKARDEAMPERLRARIAGQFDRSARRRFRPSTAWWAGWVAAAASLLVAVFAWRGDLNPAPPSAEREWTAMRALVPPIPLAATDHPLASGASGEMVWSGPDQRGFLVVRGLAGTDPARGTYQLWIFDANRDARYPVDGGIFAVADASRPTIVPVQPTLKVGNPALFAVTLEPPGGVVVSDRKRIMLTGSL